MKYILITLLVVLAIAHIPITHAATPTPTGEAESSDESAGNSLSDQINDLKDKIASRVAQLNLVDKRGVLGIVSEVKDTQIVLTDPQQKKRIIDIDEITKFASPSAKATFGISDITVGSEISVVGLYNKQSRRILARFVETITKPLFLSGIISDVDEDDFTITVLDVDKKETIIDIEKLTKTNMYTKEDDIIKSGFSKIEPGQRVMVSGYEVENNNKRLTGIRILTLPEAPKHPGIDFEIPEKAVTPTTTKKP